MADYGELLRWWNDVVEGTGVRLYIGMAAYRVDAASPTPEWRSYLQIVDQLALNRRTKNVSGEIFFRVKNLMSSQPLFSAVKKHYTGTGGVLITSEDRAALPVPVTGAGTLSVARPSGNISTTFSSYYIMGCSDPSKPLLVNVTVVGGRYPYGYYGYIVNL